MKRFILPLLAVTLVPQAARAEAPGAAIAPATPAAMTRIVATWWWWDAFIQGFTNSYGGGSGKTGTGGSGSGGATQVPEPGMMLIFGAGAGAVVLRRRRAAK